MGLLQQFKKGVDRYRSEANQRAEKRLASARTEAERDRVQSQLKRERLVRQKEIAEAQAALHKAEAARKRAAREVKDIGGGGGLFSDLQRTLGLSTSTKKKKRVVRKTTKRRG